jgi:isocitrate dehydrogenase
MNGDIISDLTSGLVGGLGLAPSANLGHDAAIFEAVHGSAPDIAGKDIANPTAMILSTVMMLRHLGEFDAASKVENALLVTLASGEGYPVDIAKGRSVVGTKAFTDLILSNIDAPTHETEERAYAPVRIPKRSGSVVASQAGQREVVGMDVFIEFDGPAAAIGQLLEEAAEGTAFKLKMISNRGTMVYPDRGADTDCVDHWRCRFTALTAAADLADDQIQALMRRVADSGLRWMHIEKLNRFDGADAFTKAQGED